MSRISFELMSPAPLDTMADAHKILDLWTQGSPSTFPTHVGGHEPVRQEFDNTRRADLKPLWRYMLLFKRFAKPRADGQVFMKFGPHRKHSMWTIASSSGASLLDELATLLCSCPGVIPADFGFVDIPQEQDWDRAVQSRTTSGQRVGKPATWYSLVTSHHLWRSVPDLYWLTLFGKPYVELFSRERLLGVPAHKVTELDGGAVAITATPTPFDPSLREAKEAIKVHLGRDAFFYPAKEPVFEMFAPIGDDGHVHRVPEFGFGWNGFA